MTTATPELARTPKAGSAACAAGRRQAGLRHAGPGRGLRAHDRRSAMRDTDLRARARPSRRRTRRRSGGRQARQPRRTRTARSATCSVALDLFGLRDVGVVDRRVDRRPFRGPRAQLRRPAPLRRRRATATSCSWSTTPVPQYPHYTKEPYEFRPDRGAAGVSRRAAQFRRRTDCALRRAATTASRSIPRRVSTRAWRWTCPRCGSPRPTAAPGRTWSPRRSWPRSSRGAARRRR